MFNRLRYTQHTESSYSTIRTTVSTSERGNFSQGYARLCWSADRAPPFGVGPMVSHWSRSSVGSAGAPAPHPFRGDFQKVLLWLVLHSSLRLPLLRLQFQQALKTRPQELLNVIAPGGCKGYRVTRSEFSSSIAIS